MQQVLLCCAEGKTFHQVPWWKCSLLRSLWSQLLPSGSLTPGSVCFHMCLITVRMQLSQRVITPHVWGCNVITSQGHSKGSLYSNARGGWKHRFHQNISF